MKRIIGLVTILSCWLLLISSCEKKSDTEILPEKVLGVTDTEILIGSSLALSGHASYLGTQTLHGALSYINYVNEKGGIHGRKIKIIAYDDEYDPPRCVSNTQKGKQVLVPCDLLNAGASFPPGYRCPPPLEQYPKDVADWCGEGPGLAPQPPPAPTSPTSPTSPTHPTSPTSTTSPASPPSPAPPR